MNVTSQKSISSTIRPNNFLVASIIVASLAVLFFSLLPFATYAAVTPDDPGNFITTWNTENPGPSNDDQITIPGTGTNYDIYWENTASSTMTGTTTATNAHTITFPEPGIYEVQISGDFTRIRFDGGGDRQKLLTIEQWGDIAWTSMDSAFQRAINLRIPATDAPDLSGVTSLYQMFLEATSFNDPVDHWDTSNVTNFGQIFRQATVFNQPLNSWNTSNGTAISAMFWDAYAFNQPLDNWDVSKVTNMESLFNDARAFNQPLNSWDVSSSTNLRAVFYQTDFNQPLDSWDVSNAEDMLFMFRDTPFNQDLSTWNVENATNMNGMFRDTPFNQDLSTWNIENVTTMSGMFINAKLSQSNQDATLQAWSQQSLQSNVPLHLGVKSYTDTGAAAIATLEDTYNWTISEQYQARYTAGEDATLQGTSNQYPITTGASTDAVTVVADSGCRFIEWNDGSAENPRSDVLTDDNLSVSAIVTCSSVTGTSARTQSSKSRVFGNEENAKEIEERFLTTTSTPTTFEAPETLEESLERVKEIPTIFKNLDPEKDRETIKELIKVLLELVQVLTLLMMEMAGE